MEFASKRPTVLAGLLLLLGASAQEGCRCQRARPPAHGDAGGALAPTAWLAGTVADRRDHPVPEARVLAFPLAGDAGTPAGATPFETATDLAGHFRFAHLPPGPYRVLVEATGFPAAELTPVQAPTDGAAVRVDGEGRSIIGK